MENYPAMNHTLLKILSIQVVCLNNILLTHFTGRARVKEQHDIHKTRCAHNLFNNSVWQLTLLLIKLWRATTLRIREERYITSIISFVFTAKGGIDEKCQ